MTIIIVQCYFAFHYMFVLIIIDYASLHKYYDKWYANAKCEFHELINVATIRVVKYAQPCC